MALNINSATYDELLTISGIGPSRAKAIIAARTECHDDLTWDYLKGVEGIPSTHWDPLIIKEGILTGGSVEFGGRADPHIRAMTSEHAPGAISGSAYVGSGLEIGDKWGLVYGSSELPKSYVGHASSLPTELEKRFQRAEKELSNIRSEIDSLKNRYQQRNGTRSPNTESPTSTRGCFECGDTSHFVRECPSSSMHSRSPSPSIRENILEGASEKPSMLHEVREVQLYSQGCIQQRKTFVLPVLLDGKICRAVVDTAAQVTVVSATFFETLETDSQLSHRIRLRGIGENLVYGRLYNQACLEIGSIREKIPVVVADIPDQMILGLDFLDKHEAVINLSVYSVQLDGETFPALCVQDTAAGRTKVYKVQLEGRTVVPPAKAMELAHPNASDTFVLDTDASNSAIGAELSQLQDGRMRVVGFGSKVLTPAQRKYCTTRKELLQAIRCHADNKQQTWDVHLQQLAGAIRATYHRQTGFTPNRLMLGREVTQPLDLLLGTAKVNSQRASADEYAAQLESAMQEAHALARDALKSSQVRQKRDYDLRAHHRSYQVGNIVLKIDSSTKVGHSPKLRTPWKGPYVVTDVLSPVLYRIRDRKGESVIHHDRLKELKSSDIPIWAKRMRDTVLAGDDITNPDRSPLVQSSTRDASPTGNQSEPVDLPSDLAEEFPPYDEEADDAGIADEPDEPHLTESNSDWGTDNGLMSSPDRVSGGTRRRRWQPQRLGYSAFGEPDLQNLEAIT